MVEYFQVSAKWERGCCHSLLEVPKNWAGVRDGRFPEPEALMTYEWYLNLHYLLVHLVPEEC